MNKINVIFVSALALLTLVRSEGEWQPKTKEQVKAIRLECLQEHPLTVEQTEEMKQLNFPDEPNVRKYLLCTAKKMDIFTEEKGYHPDRIAQQFHAGLPEEEIREIAAGCADKNEQGSPSDVWAFRGHVCLLNSRVGQMMRAFIRRKQAEAKQTPQ